MPHCLRLIPQALRMRGSFIIIQLLPPGDVDSSVQKRIFPVVVFLRLVCFVSLDGGSGLGDIITSNVQSIGVEFRSCAQRLKNRFRVV